MSISGSLCNKTIDTIKERLNLSEVLSDDGQPYTELTSPVFGSVGQVRVFKGESIDEMIYVGITVPQIHLDSHMVFAFTEDGSAVPHFTLDAVAHPEGFAFHLDLIPRLDLGANLKYMDEVYQPLSPIFDKAEKIEGLSKAHLTQRQVALMSPWMLVHRANAEAFAAMAEPVGDYLGHWLELVASGVDTNVDATTLADRNAAHRSAIFNADVDPVWNQVERLLGAESANAVRELLRLGSDQFDN